MAPQSYEPTFFLLKRRLPSSESAQILGRVVRKYQDPTLDYTPESPETCLTPDVFRQYLLGVQHDDSAHFIAQSSQNNKVGTELQSLISFSVGKAEGAQTEIVSPRITTRRLKLESDYFNELRDHAATRRRILEMCPVGGKVYLVVGTMSVKTATFIRTDVRSRSNQISGFMPVDLILNAAGVPVPIGSLPNPGISKLQEKTTGLAMSFSTVAEETADGKDEEVFAIACKEISRDWVGFGNEVKLKSKRPEYRGGQSFGSSEDSDSDEDSTEAELEASQGLHVTQTSLRAAEGDLILSNQFAVYDDVA